MLQVGSIIDGKYKVLNKIGQGGMSVVYLALNERANKTWAIKEVRKDGVQDFATVKQGLIAETNILKSLSHKYLPSIIDVIDDSDSFLIVMDYIQGKSLKEVLKQSLEQEGYPILVEDVVSWGKQLCDVLYYLHTRPNPIIYRDMKPSNVMLRPTGEISLIDFGTARVFKTGNTEDTTCLGTPGYAAPEQYGGNGQTRPETDIYCLGATMHHLITGRDPAATPFNFPKITQCRPTLLDETPRELRNKLLGLEMVIDKCTRYDIRDRYQTCAELKYDLEHLEELGLPYRKKQKKKVIIFGACAGAAALMGIGSLTGMLMENNTQKSGYDYYLAQAASGTHTEAENYEYYRNAIALNPTREEAYLNMLDAMLEDNVLSTAEDMEMIGVLNQRDNDRPRDNKSYLEANVTGYIEFSYQMGLAYYFSSENAGDGKQSAIPWFNNVINADMSKLTFYDDDGNLIDTNKWQARATIFGKISSNYKNKLGVINQLGDAEYSYGNYWNDLMALMEADVAGADGIVTELRLYNEIASQIFDKANEFKSEAGLTKNTLNDALDQIETRIANISSTSMKQSRIAQELKTDISQTIEGARRNITAAYAYDSVNTINNSTEGGNE